MKRIISLLLLVIIACGHSQSAFSFTLTDKAGPSSTSSYSSFRFYADGYLLYPTAAGGDTSQNLTLYGTTDISGTPSWSNLGNTSGSNGIGYMKVTLPNGQTIYGGVRFYKDDHADPYAEQRTYYYFTNTLGGSTTTFYAVSPTVSGLSSPNPNAPYPAGNDSGGNAYPTANSGYGDAYFLEMSMMSPWLLIGDYLYWPTGWYPNSTIRSSGSEYRATSKIYRIHYLDLLAGKPWIPWATITVPSDLSPTATSCQGYTAGGIESTLLKHPDGTVQIVSRVNFPVLISGVCDPANSNAYGTLIATATASDLSTWTNYSFAFDGAPSFGFVDYDGTLYVGSAERGNYGSGAHRKMSSPSTNGDNYTHIYSSTNKGSSWTKTDGASFWIFGYNGAMRFKDKIAGTYCSMTGGNWNHISVGNLDAITMTMSRSGSQLSAAANGTDVTNHQWIDWKSSNTSIAKVYRGQIIPVGTGSATFTADYFGNTVSQTLTLPLPTLAQAIANLASAAAVGNLGSGNSIGNLM